MFSSIRRQLSYANVVATMALVFAMGGSAIAAKHYLINSTKQISPKVLKAISNDAPPDAVLISHLLGAATVARASSATTAASAGTADTAGNAANLGGRPSTAYLLSGTSGEPWHLIGAPGEPAFQNSWVNLPPGVENAQAGFYLDPVGRVHLKGGIYKGGGPSTAFTLPPGYRPPENLAFAAAGLAGPPENVLIYTDGQVLVNSAEGKPMTLDDISFRVN